MLNKFGELTQVGASNIQSTETVIADLNDSEINERFRKFAQQLKRIAPKADDFLYFTAIMMHAAESSTLNADGTVKVTKEGIPVEATWEINQKTGSWKWSCNDSTVRPMKNANGDIFPEQELIKAYKKWVEKPLCVDHKSDSVDAVRGIILDTYYDRVHKRVIALCALDQKSFPELANGIRTGYKTCVSMGVRVGAAVCTDCGTVANVERDFCQHMKHKIGYGEINVGLDPIELSIVVNGADPQAKIRTILAHALDIRNSLDEKSQELAKIAMSEDSTAKLKELEEDIKKLSEKFTELKLSLEKEAKEVEADKAKADDIAYIPKAEAFENKQSDVTDALQMPKRLANKNALCLDDLQELKVSINSKFEDLEKGLLTLSHKIKEEIMSVKSKDAINKEGYFQGGGGVNEPAPHQVKYPKEPLNEQMREHGDKHMEGVDNMGPTDGLFPGDVERKKLVQRAAIEERTMRRAAALQKAKEKLMETKGYFQGGGGVSEPSPGKQKYPVDPGNDKARKEDKQMVGAKPFPETGDVEGLYGDDVKEKKLLQRASKLTGKFVRVAAEDGSEDRASSGWEISRGGEPLFTATVEEISGGKVDALYDTIQSQAFGLDILKKVQKLGAEKVKTMYKSAQVAPAPEAHMDAGNAMPAMPEMAPAAMAPAQTPANDKAEGDPKEVALKLAEEMRDRSSDLLEAVRVLTGEQTEMGDLEGISQAAMKNSDFKKLADMKQKLNVNLVRGMKTAIADLNASQGELEMVAEILAEEPKSIEPSTVAESISEGKEALAKARDLMSSVIQYAEGSARLAKKAQMIESCPPSDTNAAMIEDGECTDKELDEKIDEKVEKAVKEKFEELGEELVEDEEDNLEVNDMNDVMVDMDQDSLKKLDPNAKIHVSTASIDLSTKEARAAARAKLAAESLKWNPLLEQSHKVAPNAQTELDVKPSDNLGKVETVEEKHEKMLDIAEAPVKVRKEASRLNDLIKAGKVAASDLDTLVSKGLDSEVVKYWKQFYGQAGKEGSEFATELLKEHAKAQVQEEVSKFKVKIARAYELTNEMVRRGMLADERAVIATYVDEVMGWNDEAFNSMNRVVSRTPLRKSAGVFPTVGMISGSETIKQEVSLQDELDRAFSVRRY